MPSHQEIDERALAMARAIARRVDGDPRLLDDVKRWAAAQTSPAYREWILLLERPWQEVRKMLTDPSEEGKRWRQNSPFVGILTPQERWSFFPVERP